jgi:enoyl-CoA hydratase
LLLTGDSIDAEEAHRLGMVSKIFPAGDVSERTLEFARRIAELPTMTALLIKDSVNQTMDNMGFSPVPRRRAAPGSAPTWPS